LSIHKTQRVKVNEEEYEILRMTPAMASYLWQVLMRSVLRASQSVKQPETASEAATEAQEQTPEEKMRALATLAMMHMSYEDYQFLEKNCLKQVMRVEEGGLMPLMSVDGQWDKRIYEDLSRKPLVFTQLILEVLAVNLSGFFA
jgi:hypothetical protein